MVLVSADGPFCDAIVSDMDQATLIATAAGFTVGLWDRELSAAVIVSTADRVRMAGIGR